MTHDFHDFMVPTVEKFAYLKCPDKIRVAVINAGGPRLSVDAIQRRLNLLPSKVEGAHIGEPEDGDEADFRVRGLVGTQPMRPGISRITKQERETIARMAACIKDRNPDSPNQPISVRDASLPEHRIIDYPRYLIKRVCEGLEIPREVFFSASRIPYLVAARALVVKILRDRNPAAYSYPRVADIIKRRDHTTAINLYHQFDKYRVTYSVIDRLYNELRQGG